MNRTTTLGIIPNTMIGIRPTTMIGYLSYDDALDCLNDIAKVIPIVLLNGKKKWTSICNDDYLDITNSHYGINSLENVFLCKPNPYINIMAMVRNTCKRNGTNVPEWFLDKYIVPSELLDDD